MACTCCSVLSVQWRVVTEEPPAVMRRCPRCDRPRPFRSSGRFRVNASGQRLDVWLVYRCVDCEATWNRTIHERVTTAAIGDDLERYHGNDAELARALALAPPARSATVAGAARIDGPTDAPLRATLVVQQPIAARLDRLVAAHLGLSRRDIARLVTVVDAPRLLRRPPRDGSVVSLDGCRSRT